MKNTILKIAGVKNPEALYKKYATEADFLKANPKFALGGKMNIQAIQKFEFGGNEEIITPTIEANRQTYPKTITYSPQEWHQKNILAGNVMLGKNNDLNTMFKNNIYPQYTLPNDTVPINYSPVVKQLPMPQGFVDKNKGVFNYAAGQQLTKQANGGQMNFQTMPQFASGGSIFKDIGAGLYGVGEGLLDTVTLGATDQITDMGYKALQKAGGSTEDEIRQQDSIHGFSQAAGAIGGAVINPAGTGAAIGQTGKGLGEGISRGNESEEWARNTGQALNAAGAIGSIAYGNFGAAGTSGAANAGASAAGNASKLTGQSAKFAGSDFGKFAQTAGKYGSIAGQMGSVLQPMFNQQYGNNQGYKMGGQMQYAMGGMNVQPNAEAENDELVTTNTPPQVVSGGEVNMVSNNPYGTPDYAINGNNHGEGENGGGVKMNVASGSVFKGKLKNPLTGNLFKKDFKKISFQENMFTKKLENGDAYAQNTANLILPVLAKTKEDMEMYQQAILDNKKQAKDLRAGIMPGQSQGKMAMGGIQESDYQTDPAKLPSLLRQQKANDATILGMRSSFGRNADTNNVEDPLVVTFNKAKNYGKELADKIKNHPDNKKIEPFAMGGKLPMYQDGDVVPQPQQQPFYGNYSNWGNAPVQGGYTGYIPSSGDATYMQGKTGDSYIPEENYIKLQNTQNLSNQINPNAGSPSGNTQGNLGVQGPPKIEGKGFDYKKAAGNLGQFALQNAGNIYDLGRSTQDNSKLNLSRISPTFLDKTQDLQNNLRLYSEGKRQTAEASQGNASTYLSNMYANRASKLANDLNINTTYGNLNASIDNAAKLYNAGAIDKETMFKLQAEGMNRNLKGQALAGMSQNFLNQRNSDRQDALDQERLGLQKQYYKAFYDNQDRENQRRVDEITKGKSNKNSWLDCSSGNCVERTSDQTQSTQSTPFYFSQSQDKWNAMSRQQEAENEMKKLTKGKK